MLRARRFRHMALVKLEAMLVPAIISNQIMFVRGAMSTRQDKDEDKPGSAPESDRIHVPVGFALWASVSGDVRARLKQQADDGAAYRLAPNEWRSGDNQWILALVGPSQVLPALDEKVTEQIFPNSGVSRHAHANNKKA